MAEIEMTEQERAALQHLIDLARHVDHALDDSEEVQEDGLRSHIIQAQDFDDVVEAIDALNDLPDDKPGVTMNPSDKAEWALRRILVRHIATAPAAVAGPSDVVSIQRQAFIRGWDERGMAHQLKGTVETDERMRVLMDIYFPRTAAPTTQPAPQQEAQEPVDSMGIPLSCGKPLCSPGHHHPLCKLAAPPPAPQPTPASQVGALDAARLDWLLLHVSGAEFRRIGVCYSGNASRADLDAAIAAQEGK